MSASTVRRSIQYKSSIGRYLPSFVQVVGTEQLEVLRALPVHLFHVDREPRELRCLHLSPPPKHHAPRISSPLRQASAINSQSIAPLDLSGARLLVPRPVKLEPLCIPKGVATQPRVPSVIKDFSDGKLKPEPRRSAYTFTTFKERPFQSRKVAQSFKKYARPVLMNIENVARAGEHEMQMIRTKVESTKQVIAAMHKRLTALEEKFEKKRNESARH